MNNINKVGRNPSEAAIIAKINADKQEIDAASKLLPRGHGIEVFDNAWDKIDEIDSLFEEVNDKYSEKKTPLDLMEKRWTVLTDKFSVLVTIKTHLKAFGKNTDQVDEYLNTAATQLASFDEMLEDPLFENEDFRELLRKSLNNGDKLNLQKELDSAFKSYLKIKSLVKTSDQKKKQIDAWKDQKEKGTLPNDINLTAQIKYFVDLQASLANAKHQFIKTGRGIVDTLKKNAQDEDSPDLERINKTLVPFRDNWARNGSREVKLLRRKIKEEYGDVIGSRDPVVLNPGVWSRIRQSVSHQVQDPFEKLPSATPESWNLTSWGNLMLRGEPKVLLKGEPRGGKEEFVFAIAINALKQRNRDLKLELQRSEKNAELGENRAAVEKKKTAAETEIRNNKLLMHHMFIMQAVKQIRTVKKDHIQSTKRLADANKELEAAKANNNAPDIEKLEKEIRTLEMRIDRSEKDISILESTFAHYFTKYSREYADLPEKGLLEKTFGAIREVVPYVPKDFPSPTQLYREKTYAQFGKERLEYVREHLKPLTDALGVKNGTVTLPNNALAAEWIKKTIDGFTEWSGRHPEEAVILTADILHTIGEAQGEGAFNAFKGRLTALTYVCSNFAQQRVHEPITEEKDLLYFALADYAPLVLTGVSLTKGAKDGYDIGAQVGRDLGVPLAPFALGMATAVVGGVFNVAKTVAVREAANKIDIESAPIVNIISGIMGGEELYNVFEAQQTEAVKEIAYGAMSAVTEKGFLKETWSQVKIWWNSVGKSKTPEEKTWRVRIQRILPAIGAAVAGFFLSPPGAAAAVTLGLLGPVGWAVLILGFTVTASWVGYRALNTVYKSSIAEATDDEIRSTLNSGENLRLHRELVSSYVRDLKQTGFLPDLIAPDKKEKEKIEKYKEIIKEAKERLMQKLEQELENRIKEFAERGITLSTKEYVKIFAKNLKIKDVRKELQSDISKLFKQKDAKNESDKLDIEIATEDDEYLVLPDVELVEIGVKEIISDLETKWLLPNVDKALEEETVLVYKNTTREDAQIARRLTHIAPAKPTLKKKIEDKIEEQLSRKISVALNEDGNTVKTIVRCYNADRFDRHANVPPAQIEII